MRQRNDESEAVAKAGDGDVKSVGVVAREVKQPMTMERAWSDGRRQTTKPWESKV